MRFLKTVWAIVRGVKDVLVLLFMLLFFGLLWAALTLQPGAPARVAQGSALVLAFDGFLVEQARDVSPLMLAGARPFGETEAAGVVLALDEAADDGRIALVVLDLDGFLSGGDAHLDEIARAIARVRAAGKPVLAWSTAYTDSSWLLAAHADEVWMSPLGAAIVTGPGGTQLFFAEALERLNLDVEIFRAGDLKTAVEPFTRQDRSPESRAMEERLARQLWARNQAVARAARPRVELAGYPARLVAAAGRTDLAAFAVQQGLVDRLASRSDFEGAIRQRVGRDPRDDGAPFLAVDHLAYARGRAPRPAAGRTVGILPVAGTIVDGTAPRGTAGADTIAERLREAVAGGEIDALVVRIDSPGGTVTGSETIRQAILAARAEGIPVVASMGPVAASGGYWVSTAAEHVVAHPASITGSIGVFGVIPTFGRALDSLGIGADRLAITPLGGQPDLIGGLNPEARALLSGLVGDSWRRFVALVASARGMAPTAVAPLADGRVLTGAEARRLGLVDELGGLDVAVAQAARRAGIEVEPRVVRLDPALPFLARLFRDATGIDSAPPSPPARGLDAAARLALTAQAATVRQLVDAHAVALRPAVRAQCLACPPRPAATDAAALALAGKLLR